MYWHIDTDLVSLVILLAVYIYLEKTLPHDDKNQRQSGFLWCFRFGIIVTLIDIAASIVMEIPVSSFIFHLFMTLYFVTLENVFLGWFIYSLSIIYHDDNRKMRLIAVLASVPYLIYTVLACANPWTGMFYTLGANDAYQRGPLFFLMVVLFLVYTVALFVLIIVRWKHVQRIYSSHVLLLTPIILAIAITLQLLNEGWLMIMPGYTVCLVIAFLFLQTKQARDSQLLVQNLSTAALRDKMTGLYNRAGAEAMIQKSFLNDYGKTCLVIVTDLDDLKKINDTLGHVEGDRAIRDYAEQLQRHFRSSDIVARFGGDEFLVYLTGNLSELQAHRSLQLLVEELAALYVGADNNYQLHGSVGAVFGVVGCDDFEMLCNRADMALYHVKRNGKRNYAFFRPDMDETIDSHEQLVIPI